MNVKPGKSGFWEFIAAIQKQKQIDHEASHSNLINQYLHLWSSSIFLYCAAIVLSDYRRAIYLGLFSLVIRQAGHYIFEPPCAEKEQAMLGFDTAAKVKIVILYFVLPSLMLVQLTQIESVQAFINQHDITVAEIWIAATLCIVFGRVFVLWYRFDFVTSQHWLWKFVTDPITDIPAYWRSSYQILNPRLVRYALHRSFPSRISAPANMTEAEIREVEHGNGFPGTSTV